MNRAIYALAVSLLLLMAAWAMPEKTKGAATAEPPGWGSRQQNTEVYTSTVSQEYAVKKAHCHNPEVMPCFDGRAWTDFSGWVKESIDRKGHCPGIPDDVMVLFTVDRDGSLCDFELLSCPNEEFGRQLLSVMENSPMWIPAKGRMAEYENGELAYVPVRMLLKIDFTENL